SQRTRGTIPEGTDGGVRPFELRRDLGRALRVVGRAEPVDHDRRLVAAPPGVVPARERGDVPRLGHELRAVVHPDREPPAHGILKMRRLATLGLPDRLYFLRP